jgi:hypothetical protein
MAVGNLFRIPRSISAPTREGLERVMLKNNLKYGIEFRYFDIQKVGSEWIAWFNVVIDKDKLLARIGNKEVVGG